ncbi:hypothetical protein BST63_17995 [Bradyrhizobium canariense]|uniref:Uncharacterized protein n=2 Tax=Bradyrhizobium canariense TaxID=255045 RepID=A0ABX3X2C5_9BRAD|nr:hypothetical protein BSR47_19555 [Bradyrhizobium canariense]OSJ28064.1 hypothetical protein BST63_17995 [Bradyrhizobium canariense]
MLVGRLIDLMWRQKRVRQHDDQLLQAHIDSVQASNDRVPLRAALQAMAPEFALADTVKKVETLLKKHKHYAKVIVHWVPRPTDAEKEATWGAAISEYLKNLKVGEVVEGPSEITTFVDPFKVELQEDRMGRLDDRILTVTKRLVQVKASKDLLAPRNVPPKMVGVNAPSAASPGLTIDNEADSNGTVDRVSTSEEIRWVPSPIDYRSGNKPLLKHLEDQETSGAIFTMAAKTVRK